VKEYASFQNLFDIVVHDNSDLRTVVKFSYLRAYIDGEQLKIITNLTLSDNSHNISLKMLDDLYSNRRIIVQSFRSVVGYAEKQCLVMRKPFEILY